MKKEKPTTKICKYCKTEIPFDAKVCPQCRKKQGGHGCLTAIVVVVAIGTLGSCFSGGKSNSKSADTETVTTAEATTEVAETTTGNDAQEDLTSKYELSGPIPVSHDKTGKWFLTRTSTSIPPANYAYDYAKTFVNNDEIHFIVNYSLNTTTKISEALGVVSVLTYEHVNKEELDANSLPSGELLTEDYFDASTGEEITVGADANAGEANEEDLVSTVTEAINGSVGEGEQITSVVLDDKNLIITVDLSGATIPDSLSARDIALMRIPSITDNILGLNDTYYNAWDTITLDFGAEGTAVLNKSMVKNEGYGNFFSFDDSILR